MLFANLTSIALWMAFATNLAQVVMGWAFGFPPRVVEGINAEFRVVNDGEEFYLQPYTMTVLKKVLKRPDQQVGLVYANKTPFYWDCNQRAGTVLEFRLVSKANVNVASSGNITVQSAAEAFEWIESISSQSVESTKLLFLHTATGQATPTGSNGDPSASTPLGGGSEVSNTKRISTGVVVGVGIAGALLLITLFFVVWWVYRRRNPKSMQEAAHSSDTVAPFMQSYQPPAGYVSAYTHSYEDPPQYTPPPEPTNTSSPTNYSSTYASTSAFSGPMATAMMSERDNPRGPVQNEKRRHPSRGVVQH
ncbi:hypothetical protein FRC08_005281 [Ceratobasidium sp. 394]|nr:hypothetical protein FRC08_005281 [Ceratobasidium sp. 394]KAG9089416.1 hypothetical protein FS749_001351 [Ceratobasidium sp. UAMH 11750]